VDAEIVLDVSGVVWGAEVACIVDIKLGCIRNTGHEGGPGQAELSGGRGRVGLGEEVVHERVTAGCAGAGEDCVMVTPFFHAVFQRVFAPNADILPLTARWSRAG